MTTPLLTVICPPYLMLLGLHIAYMHATFDHSNSSHSGDIVGAHQNIKSSRDLTTPLQGWFVTHWLALTTINLYQI